MAEGRVGLVAGSGALPGEAARCLSESGVAFDLLGFEGISDPALVAPEARIRLGQIDALVNRMQATGAKALLIVGNFDPALVRAPSPLFEPDDTARRLFEGAPPEAHVAWMSTLADFLEEVGLPLARQDTLLGPLLARPGPLGPMPPTRVHRADLEVGRAALAVQPASVLGQAIAVKDGEVVARETLEGTDALIRRAGREAGPGVTIVKAARPGQDPRLDLPVIGPTTIETLAAAGVEALAVEAGATLVIDAVGTARAAGSHRRVLWAFAPNEAAEGA